MDGGEGGQMPAAGLGPGVEKTPRVGRVSNKQEAWFASKGTFTFSHSPSELYEGRGGASLLLVKRRWPLHDSAGHPQANPVITFSYKTGSIQECKCPVPRNSQNSKEIRGWGRSYFGFGSLGQFRGTSEGPCRLLSAAPMAPFSSPGCWTAHPQPPSSPCLALQVTLLDRRPHTSLSPGVTHTGPKETLTYPMYPLPLGGKVRQQNFPASASKSVLLHLLPGFLDPQALLTSHVGSDLSP